DAAARIRSFPVPNGPRVQDTPAIPLESNAHCWSALRWIALIDLWAGVRCTGTSTENRADSSGHAVRSWFADGSYLHCVHYWASCPTVPIDSKPYRIPAASRPRKDTAPMLGV